MSPFLQRFFLLELEKASRESHARVAQLEEAIAQREREAQQERGRGEAAAAETNAFLERMRRGSRRP